MGIMRKGKARRASLLLGVVLALLVLGGCVGVGAGGPDIGAQARLRAQNPRRPPADDRGAFRNIPYRADAVVTLDAGTLHDLYAGILQTYVDPVDSGTLIEGALKGIQQSAIQEGISPLDTAVLELMSVRVSRDPERDWAQFAVRYEAYLEKSANRVSIWPIGQAAARGMVEALGDPNSAYLDRQAVEGQKVGEAGVGVTLAVGAQRGPAIAREVVPGSPAEGAGIRPGDTIVAVDGNPTDSMTLGESAQAIRGINGTPVKLSVRSAGEADPRDITVTRAILNAPPVLAEARGEFEYVKVRRFQEGVARSVQNALADSARSGARGWIIDLRAANSGSIQEVIDLASLFVGPRPITAVVDRTQRPSQIRGQSPPLEARLPTVVLIDSGTGSGGEILAAALREYQAATLVGSRTAGKVGLSQVVSLPDGSAVQITAQRFLTPSGGKLEGIGVEPDYPVDSGATDWVEGRDPQLTRAMAILRDVSPES
jgi:carboxyl-terminal processing protease